MNRNMCDVTSTYAISAAPTPIPNNAITAETTTLQLMPGTTSPDATPEDEAAAPVPLALPLV